jgi:hypothetical protein
VSSSVLKRIAQSDPGASFLAGTGPADAQAVSSPDLAASMVRKLK